MAGRIGSVVLVGAALATITSVATAQDSQWYIGVWPDGRTCIPLEYPGQTPEQFAAKLPGMSPSVERARSPEGFSIAAVHVQIGADFPGTIAMVQGHQNCLTLMQRAREQGKCY